MYHGDDDYEDYGYDGSSFHHSYLCYPVSLINKPHLENGTKIIMPPSALYQLASLDIDYPMLFEICNPATLRVSHCGVLEFSADEDLIFLPSCMMENMLLEEGDTVLLTTATLSKANYVKLQPHTKDFLELSDPKAILGRTLRNFSCLTLGDTIMVDYMNKKFYIDVIEAKPSNATGIIETDCEVDFAPPLDYKEPEKPAQSNPPSKSADQVQEESAKEEPKFRPFTGMARRLDGQPSTLSIESVPTPVLNDHISEAANRPNRSNSSSASSHRRLGKLVFGSNVSQDRKEMPKITTNDTSREPPEKEEQKFQAFSGKRYSLTG